ncbi:MAG: alanyl-tRNA editing protein [archaeon]
MTEKLYLNDSYLKECSAKVILVDGNKIILDKTVFYAKSGGQPSDLGKVIKSATGEEFNVILVRNEAGLHLHEVDKLGLVAGDVVVCKINWNLRYSHMRMHTSADILAAVIFNETNALITGNQLGDKESRMDFSINGFDRSFLVSIQDKANEIVKENLPITISFEARDSALLRPELFRLKDVLPKDIPIFRIISIGTFDIQADGGTHVHSTSEVGKIEIFDLKNKGAENRRIYWKLE